MELEDAESDRRILEVTKEELFFIQHCIVLVGCSITGNIQGSTKNLFTLMQLLEAGFDVEDLQKRILSVAGVDISKLKEIKQGTLLTLEDKSVQ